MYNLRKRKTYDEMIKELNNQPSITYPNRKWTNMLNNIIISNLLFDNIDDIIEQNGRIITLDQSTQTPYQRWTQTKILNEETQKPYELQHYDLHPQLYHRIDAMSKYMKHIEDIQIKNDATSNQIKTEDKNIYDNSNQTSSYIPNSLKSKSDNINQTVRYMLKQIDPQKESEGDFKDWYAGLDKKSSSRESLPQVVDPDNNPRYVDYLIGLTLPRMQIPSSSNPSVPTATLPPSSPSISPPASDIELTQQQIRERSRSRDSSIDKRSSKK